MERLTEKRDGQNVIPLRQDGKTKWSLCSAGMGDASTQFLYGEHADKLAEYEDLEEQGKLLKLPCAVGDKIYRIDTDEKLESREIEICYIDNIVMFTDGTILLKYDAYDGVICELENITTDKPYLDFYRCFLTKSAAEQALKEMEAVE